jgi:hypothetical protein
MIELEFDVVLLYNGFTHKQDSIYLYIIFEVFNVKTHKPESHDSNSRLISYTRLYRIR